MTASVELTGLKGLSHKVKALIDLPLFSFVTGDIGMFAMTNIKRRTLKGESVDALSFKPYNPLYAKERAEKGYKTSPVDLMRTGAMLASMTYTENKDSVELFFMNTQDQENVSNASKAFWNNEEREFFALSPSDVKGIMKIVNKYYKILMKS